MPQPRPPSDPAPLDMTQESCSRVRANGYASSTFGVSFVNYFNICSVQRFGRSWGHCGMGLILVS